MISERMAVKALEKYNRSQKTQSDEDRLITEMRKIFSSPPHRKRKDSDIVSDEIKKAAIDNKLSSFIHGNTIVEYKGDYYIIPKKENKEDYFSCIATVLVQDEDKFIELYIRALGGDSYGDRVYTSASYYNYSELFSNFSYHSVNSVSKDGRYQDNIKKAVQLIKEYKEPNFNPFQE